MNSTRLFLAVTLACALAACSSNSTVTTGGGSTGGDGTATGSTTGGSGSSGSTSGGTTGTSPLGTCQSCPGNAACGSGICGSLGQDTFCLDGCGAGCPAGEICEQIYDANSLTQNACVPNTGSCTSNPANGACASGCPGGYCDAAAGQCVTPTGSSTSGTTTGGSTTSGTTGSTGDCGANLAPSTPDTNHVCTCTTSNTSQCQVNDCYGGWYCDTQTGHCIPQSTACGTSTSSTSGTTTSGGTTGSTTTGGTSGGSTAGAPWTGSVNQSGGSVNRLYFAAVGDSRPPNEDDVSGYPTAVITKIYQDMQDLSPRPQFVAATGDYMFANPCGSTGAQQMDLYLQARGAYQGVVFPAMGNHECTGYTASNCVLSGSSSCSSSTTSASNNYATFMSQLVQPIGQTKPYYRFDVNDSAGTWTAKFLVLAMNAWSSTQGTWLTTQLQQPTTYTFIIRHEPESATTAPGVTASDNIISQYPYTMKIVGHTHEFAYYSGRQVIVGNGGAPLANSYSTYGYALIQQLADGNLQVDAYDYQSNAPVKTFIISK